MHVFVRICPYEIFAGNVIEGCMQLNPEIYRVFFFQNLFCLYEAQAAQQQITPKVEEENPKP